MGIGFTAQGLPLYYLHRGPGGSPLTQPTVKKMSFAKAVLDAYGGVYPVHPDADMDHRKCLAAALRKVVDELTFKDLPDFPQKTEWNMGYWAAQVQYSKELLELAKSLEGAQGNV